MWPSEVVGRYGDTLYIRWNTVYIWYSETVCYWLTIDGAYGKVTNLRHLWWRKWMYYKCAHDYRSSGETYKFDIVPHWNIQIYFIVSN